VGDGAATKGAEPSEVVEGCAMSVRKSYKYKLQPTAIQERRLAEIVELCRQLYNTGLEERITAYRRCGVSLTVTQQHAELPVIRAAFPDYGAIHSQVLQDVLTRLDKTYQAFFRRLKAGQTPGFPRFRGVNRYHSFTYTQFGNGAHLDNQILVLSKVGRLAVRWSRRWKAPPRPSPSVMKRTAGTRFSPAPMFPPSPYH
jgi:putative transposase